MGHIEITEREKELYDLCKYEVSEKQFIALIRLKRRMKRLGWAYEGVSNPRGKVLIFGLKTVAGVRHWIQVDGNGDVIPVPVGMKGIS